VDFFVAIVVGFFIFVSLMSALGRIRAENARRELHRLEQSQVQVWILKACEESLGAFETIPKHLVTVEQELDVAEWEFRDGAFSPFWDSIERAMSTLGAVDSDVKLISSSSSRYRQLAASYEGRPPPFPVDPESAQWLAAANETTGRLQRLVREAQRNFQFATIYEQRKTSAILIAGFTKLGDAIYGLGDSLGYQIENLCFSMSELHAASMSERRALRAALSDQAEDQAKRLKTAVAMLDNIQRRRIPPIYAA
jgi:hypothetical protein